MCKLLLVAFVVLTNNSLQWRSTTTQGMCTNGGAVHVGGGAVPTSDGPIFYGGAYGISIEARLGSHVQQVL